MQVPVLNGTYADENADFRTSYPLNLMPVPRPQGISSGYLRPAEGVVSLAVGPGVDRGAIRWQDQCYRVMGTRLVRVDGLGNVTELGTIQGSDQVTMDYSFDRLAIAAANRLYYYDGSALTQVTDPDLGNVLDVLWVDGYFMTTDGENLVVTELNDPAAVDPLKYGSSEADPDPVKALVKVRNEPYALNRYTIEVFDNVGGAGFPFQRIDGAQIQRGTVGTHTACLFSDVVAFVGGGRDEALAVWLGASGQTVKISTREIDQLLTEYTENVVSQGLLEARIYGGHRLLYFHLPDKTLVYDAAASEVVGEPVWFVLSSSTSGSGKYRARNFVWCHDKWLAGDTASASVGYLTKNISSHWGQHIKWEFGTSVLYNEGRGAQVHRVELVSLTGRQALSTDARIATCYSNDGETWSQDRFISIGGEGNRKKRLVWLQQGPIRNWRVQRFWGLSDSMVSPARLELQVEPLGV